LRFPEVFFLTAAFFTCFFELVRRTDDLEVDALRTEVFEDEDLRAEVLDFLDGALLLNADLRRILPLL